MQNNVLESGLHLGLSQWAWFILTVSQQRPGSPHALTWRKHANMEKAGTANPSCSLFLITFEAWGGCEATDLIRQTHLQEQVLSLTLLGIFVSLSGHLQDLATSDTASY